MAVRRRLHKRGFLWLTCAAVTLCGCANDLAPGANAPEPGTVDYLLEWNVEGLQLHDQGGWSVTTDMGYVVSLDAGWLVSYSVQLVPCQTAHSRVRQWVHQGLALLRPVQTAWAGHGDDNDVSTAVGIVENLATLDPTRREGLLLGDADYCSIHYLVARADHNVVEQPEGVSLDRRSLTANGSYTRVSDGVSGEFSIDTATAFGVLLDLPEGTIIRANDAALVVVTRMVTELFNGVDMATANNIDLERALVRALVESARVELQ